MKSPPHPSHPHIGNFVTTEKISQLGSAIETMRWGCGDPFNLIKANKLLLTSAKDNYYVTIHKTRFDIVPFLTSECLRRIVLLHWILGFQNLTLSLLGWQNQILRSQSYYIVSFVRSSSTYSGLIHTQAGTYLFQIWNKDANNIYICTER